MTDLNTRIKNQVEDVTPFMDNLEASFPALNPLSQTRFHLDPSINLLKSGNEKRSGGFDAPNARLQFESMKIVVLTLLNRIDALEEQVDPRLPDQLDLREEVSQFEAALIRAALTSTHGRQRRAARVLGMKVSTLNAKIQRYRGVNEARRTAPVS